ncbi:hypothetical protein [Glycomyces sp. L485]|nr:hypothetical protein [Glycomyces sp. L485]
MRVIEARQHQDTNMQAALFFLFEGKVEQAKLRAWGDVRPQTDRLF